MIRGVQPSITPARDAVLDWDIEVDDARRAIDQALDRLRIAVREQDRSELYLAWLKDLAEEIRV